MRTSTKMAMKRRMLDTIRPSEICSGPSASSAGIMNVTRANESQLATANRQSEMISGSSGRHQLRPAPE